MLKTILGGNNIEMGVVKLLLIRANVLFCQTSISTFHLCGVSVQWKALISVAGRNVHEALQMLEEGQPPM